jgi:type I restriction enzyme R subunit
MNPEQLARQEIDRKLKQASWIIQDVKEFNPAAALGVAVREFPTETGPADYMLFVDREPVGIIEAKEANKGLNLIAAEDQALRYAISKLKWKKDGKVLPFIYESNGEIIFFNDNRDPKPRSRELFSFHRPDTLQLWIKQGESLRKRLQLFRTDQVLAKSELFKTALRDCQINAISNLEKSFADGRPRALIQMATGSGKTFTAISSVYRLLKFAKAKRILFLVDTKNLGEQAEQEFQAFTPNDDQRKFTELYNVQRLSKSFVDKSAQVCISTIQRMYSILRNEELDESLELQSFNEWKLIEKPTDVVYNSNVPIETFDFIIVDECHRSIYNLWKQVLDYFDAFTIGLTATPDNRTIAFFNQNMVSEYTHEEAVRDKVNVGFEVYTIETEITKKGAKVVKSEYFHRFRHKQTRKVRYGQLDEDMDYGATDLDRSVMNPSQIRTVFKTFKEKLFTEIFPGRTEVPKTLIFAKTDSHADDIIRIAREEFNEENRFCKKITYNSQEDPKTLLADFRSNYYPRIAVTIDMIATGTDVKPLECIIFMRDVRSQNYFVQMLGRGTRTMGFDDLKKVTIDVEQEKQGFVVVDAVGVFNSDKVQMQPLERKRNISTKDLMMNVAMNPESDEDTLISLANRLIQFERKLTSKEKETAVEISGGRNITQITAELLEAYDPDKHIDIAKKQFALDEKQQPSELQLKQVKSEILRKATEVFCNDKFRNFVIETKQKHEQLIDEVNIDKMLAAGWDKSAKEKATEIITEFKTYIGQNKDEIVALQIFYAQPWRRRELSFEMIKDLCEKLIADKPLLAPFNVWKAYEQLETVNGKQPADKLIALVSLIRKVAGIDNELTAYDITVNRNFQHWVFRKQEGTLKFTEEQMQWLRMIKDYITSSVHIAKDDFDLSPFAENGGLGKMWKLFGEKTDELIVELNEVLAA